PLALAWLERNRKALESRSAQAVRTLMKKSFYSVFGVGDYTLSPWRVAWRRVANELDVAVVNASSEPRLVSDSTLVEITCSSQREAHFVAGVMNSSLYRLAVANYIVLHPDVHILDNLFIPKFDPTSTLHEEIANEAERLSSGAADVENAIHVSLDSL